MSIWSLIERRLAWGCAIGILALLIAPGQLVAQTPLPGIVIIADPGTESGENLPAADNLGGRATATIDPNAANATGSRLPGTARDIPASAEAIDQATMQERGKQTWSEALEGLTGFTSASRPGASGVMSARGFTENGFALLYDGIRVASTTISSRNYDSFTFERIEVLRGPASVLYGEGAVGGAINLVRKQPSGMEEPFETITSFSSAEGFRQGIGKGGTIGKDIAYRIDGVINRYDGQVDGNQLQLGTVAGAVKWNVTERLSTTVDFDIMRSRVEDAYWGTPLVGGRIDPRLRDVNYNNLPDNKYNDDVDWFRWSVDYEAGGGLTLRNQAWSYQADRDWVNTYRFVHTPEGATCSFRGQSIVNDTGSEKVCRLTWENLAYDHEFVGDRFDASWNGKVAGLPVAAVAGVEVGRTRWDSPRSEITSPQLVDPLNPDPADFDERGEARTQRVVAELGQSAVFGEGRVEILPGVKFVGAYRADWLDVDYERKPANQFYSNEYQPNTYRAGLVWDIWKDTTLYAQYATAVEPRFALFTLGAGDMAFILTNARQVEAGIKQTLSNGRLDLLASVYRIEKTDVPTTDTVSGESVQVGEQSSQGMEIGVSWRPLDGLRIDANLALVDARYDEYATSTTADFSGNRPPNVPETVANLGVSWQMLPSWTVGGWLHYHSSIMADDANTVSLPGAAVLDLFATCRIADNADLTFRIDNALDELYAAWATDANYVILGESRTVSATLRTRF